MKPLALLMLSPGTNNERETAWAFELAGARVEQHPLEGLLKNPAPLKRARILMFPGGFSYGDDLGAGRIAALGLRTALADALRDHLRRGGLVMGHCNGFQILVQSGLLPGIPGPRGGPAATLALNARGRFECRWVPLKVVTPGIFLRGLDELELPIAHAEGRFLTASPEVLRTLRRNGQVALAYRGRSPNGAEAGIAGITDPTGRVLGMMPHPERFLLREQHPDWRRLGSLPREGLGLRVYRNAVEWLR